MEEINFEFKHFDTNNTADLIEIYTSCFGIKPDENYFKWKYIDNPAGKCEAFIAIHNDKVAGFHGVIPEDYIVNGKRYIIFQAIDVMVHSEYRRMGLFTKCGEKLYDYILDRDGDIYTIAFPGITAPSYNGFLKGLNWSIGKVLKFYFVNKLLFKISNVPKKTSNFTVSPFTRFDEKFNSYFKVRKLSEKPIQRVIDAKFLNWRYFDGPLSDFKAFKFEFNDDVIGFVILKIEAKNRCFVHFLDAKEPSKIGALIGPLCNYAFETLRTKFVFTIESTDIFLMNGLKKNGFIYNPFNIGPFSYRPAVVLNSNKNTINNLEYYDLNNFLIQPVLRDY